jgi:radical SAM protein with 4Fe4S-binding SPASM domain
MNNISINNYNNYSFFFVETTSDCNLKCSYCYFKKDKKKPQYTTDILVEKLKKFDHLIICFLGGEPFLNIPFMKDIINNSLLEHKDVLYATNTNGTLIDQMEPNLLTKFSFHHLSIDGYGHNHDVYRGDGTYSKILNNLKYLKTYSKAGVVARMTITQPSQILDIPKFCSDFDAVYWQINNTRASLSENFIDDYKKSLTAVFEFWQDVYKQITGFTVIPIIGLCDLILTGGMKYPNLLCGSGTNHFNICIDGSVYPCPESPNRLDEKEKLGNLNKFQARTYTYKKRCINCSILNYCGGRCAMTDDDLYCECIFHLYELIQVFVSNLNTSELVKLKEIIAFQKTLAYTTEIIP